ncbi:MAG TPA: hypothetical protein VK636_14895 [Gemmatimonadaceae bacterium]|nr:hypothetical protein [Gemmatimonadaceae bacterium]
MRAFTRAVLIAASALPTALVAQGVTVQSNADVRLYGALGTIAGFAARMGGGNMHDIQSTTVVAGHKLRTESVNSATIIDADAGRLTHIDQKQKTYTTMTFAEMAAAMEQAKQSAQQNAQKAKAEQAKDPKAPKGDMDVKYKVAVDRPGQHEKVAGYDAERVFITVTLEGEAKPEGEKAEQVGSMVFLLDQWMSKDAPQIAALQEFQRAYATKVGQTFRPQLDGMQAAMSSDPRIKEGFGAAAKELAKVPGVSLRSMTYVALVPAGQAFDRQMVLNDVGAAAKADSAAKKDDKPKAGGFRGLMGAIKSAAEDANKQQPADKNAQGAPPKQATLMSVKDEITSITPGAVAADAFDVPAGYREIKPRAPSSP